MTDPKDRPPDFSDLRRRAEALQAAEAIPPEDSPRPGHQPHPRLRVHQIELEMQNDEFRLSQARLEEFRSKYADLCGYAPAGYLTLDGQDRIVEANLTAATLLGVERSKVLNPFFPFPDRRRPPGFSPAAEQRPEPPGAAGGVSPPGQPRRPASHAPGYPLP